MRSSEISSCTPPTRPHHSRVSSDIAPPASPMCAVTASIRQTTPMGNASRPASHTLRTAVEGDRQRVRRQPHEERAQGAGRAAAHDEHHRRPRTAVLPLGAVFEAAPCEAADQGRAPRCPRRRARQPGHLRGHPAVKPGSRAHAHMTGAHQPGRRPVPAPPPSRTPCADRQTTPRPWSAADVRDRARSVRDAGRDRQHEERRRRAGAAASPRTRRARAPRRWRRPATAGRAGPAATG